MSRNCPSEQVRYRQGAEHGIKQPSTCHGDGARRVRRGTALQRRTHGITQVQGPLGEVKPLRPAFGVLHCLERFTVQGELVDLEVATMAKTLELRLQIPNRTEGEESNPLPGRAPPPFIGVLDLFCPNIWAGRVTTRQIGRAHF